MPSAEDIQMQQQLLGSHRRTLSVYLERLALQGAAHAAPEVVHGIDDARRQIRAIKGTLRAWDVAVADLPCDEEVPAESSIAASSTHAPGGNMTFFDQRGQSVSHQYNAAGNITVGSVQTAVDLLDQLETLKREIARAETAQAIDEDAATDATYQVTKAIQQARKPAPDTARIQEHLGSGLQSLRASGAADELLSAFDSAIRVARRLP